MEHLQLRTRLHAGVFERLDYFRDGRWTYFKPASRRVRGLKQPFDRGCPIDEPDSFVEPARDDQRTDVADSDVLRAKCKNPVP